MECKCSRKRQKTDHKRDTFISTEEALAKYDAMSIVLSFLGSLRDFWALIIVSKKWHKTSSHSCISRFQRTGIHYPHMGGYLLMEHHSIHCLGDTIHCLGDTIHLWDQWDILGAQMHGTSYSSNLCFKKRAHLHLMKPFLME